MADGIWFEFEGLKCSLTLTLLTWRIWWAANNASRWQMGFDSAFEGLKCPLTLNPLTWKIWWAANNASRWQMGFNLAFKGLNCPLTRQIQCDTESKICFEASLVKRIIQIAGWSELRLHEDYFLCDVMPYSLVVIYTFFWSTQYGRYLNLKKNYFFLLLIWGQQFSQHLATRPHGVIFRKTCTWHASCALQQNFHLSGSRLSGLPIIRNVLTLRQRAKVRMVWSYRKNARNKNGQSNTHLETHFKEANRETKDTMGGWC